MVKHSDKPVRLWMGGKDKGPCCRATIDPGWGCINQCVACYCGKTNRKGNIYYESPASRKFDRDVLEKSIRRAKRKGIRYARAGKHCDPGHHIGLLLQVMDVCNACGFRLVVVTKSMPYDRKVSKELLKGSHTLHMSLGMISSRIPSNIERLNTGLFYMQDGVDVRFRIVGDVTSEMPSEFSSIPVEERIITPIHFPSQHHMPAYNVDRSNYRFSHGYWTPLFAHGSWLPASDFCGEVADTNYCCACKAA